MKIAHYSLAKLKREIHKIVGKHLDLSIYKLFFFGSRVTGGGTERSDIDIGIEGPEKIDWGIMGRIKDEIDEMHILYKIDIVDFKSVTDEFKEVATQKIEYF